jgi:choline-sulfatase
MRKCLCFDDEFDNAMVRRAISAYFGLTTFMDDNVGKILAALEASGQLQNTRVIYSSDHGDNLGTRGMWGKSTMYEESAGIPLIMAGPDIPQGKVCDTPVTLVDAFQTIVDSVGARRDARDAALPGTSLIDIAQGNAPARTILSEYHAAGAVCGSYMIRHGQYKFIYYVGLPPMLFDLAADPNEKKDLGQDPAYAAVRSECEAALRKVVDPEKADREAKADQAAKIASIGGKEAILKRGTFRYSPPPGVKPSYF